MRVEKVVRKESDIASHIPFVTFCTGVYNLLNHLSFLKWWWEVRLKPTPFLVFFFKIFIHWYSIHCLVILAMIGTVIVHDR